MAETSAPPQHFRRGTRVFMNSAGLGTVVDFASRGEDGQPKPFNPQTDRAAFYVIKTAEVVACVPIASAHETVRPLTSVEVATEMLEVLRGPVPPPDGSKSLLERGKDVVHDGRPLAQALLLRELFDLPVPLSDALGTGVGFVSRLVLSELAAVLEIPLADLEAEMQKRYPAAQEAGLHPR